MIDSDYRALVEGSPVLVWRSGPDGRCDYVNDTWLRFTGRAVEQVLGDGWTRDVHPEDLARVLESQRGLSSRREPLQRELRLRRHDGQFRAIVDHAVPRFEEGGFAGFIGACMDVQDRRELDKAKNSFLSMMAHEMRSPLSALSTYVELVRRKVDAGQMPAVATLGKMLRQVRTFSRLITDLSTTAKLEDGRTLDILPEEMELAPWLSEQVALFIDESGVGEVDADPKQTLVVEVEPGAHIVVADGNRLAQALRCVLDNAHKFTPLGGELRVRLCKEGDDQLLSVADPGIGIPDGEVAFVTRRYFRGSNVDPKNFRGMGLGLFFTHEIVGAHGGRLEISSTAGRGTTVTIRLPRAAK